MKRFLYVSLCVFSEFDVHDLEILRHSLSHNALAGINGFLHRTRTHYFQCIEGPQTEINNLITKIYIDRRHSEFTVLKEERIQSTKFPGWSMGYSGSKSQHLGQAISPASATGDILEFLLREAHCQLSVLDRKKQSDFALQT